MATTTELIETLADALGIEHKAIDLRARFLREAGYLPTGRRARNGTAEVTVEHAVALLLAVMSDYPVTKAADGARLYARLPFDHVTRMEPMPDGRDEMLTVADTAPLVADVRGLGETFGAFLAAAIRMFSGPPDVILEPGEIVVGGGLGTATAGVMFSAWDGGDPVIGFVKFSLVPMGAGRRPDDAAVARLDIHASVPGEIFQVFRDLFVGNSDGPHEATVSRAVVAGHRSANRNSS